MRSVVVVVACLALAMAMIGCGAGTPAAAPGTGATATVVVAPTQAPTTAATEVPTVVAATEVPTTAATTAATAAPAATTATGGATGNTAEALAQAGRGVYTQHCALCHGERGEGTSAPAVIGDAANMAEYGTGKGLYDYVHQAMPLTAPGSLTDEQYLQVVTYILVENDLIDAGATVDLNALEQIQIQ